MHKPIMSLELDEYEVDQKRPFCCRAVCCWKFKKFRGERTDQPTKRDSDVFYRRFSDLQQQGDVDAEEETNDDQLVYDEEVFYTDGTLMLGDVSQTIAKTASVHSRIDDSTQVEIDLGVASQDTVSFHITKRVDECVQTDDLNGGQGPHHCKRCQQMHNALLSEEQWFDDPNQNTCILDSITSSATWWTAGSLAGTPGKEQCPHTQDRLRSAKSESDTQLVSDSKDQKVQDTLDNNAKKISRVKSDGVAYGYKFCWDNLTLSDNEASNSDPAESPSSGYNMHDFEDGSMEMESPFLDSNESLLSDDIMGGCEFESPGSSYLNMLENKNNRLADITFHNQDQSWRLEREKGRRQDNLLELLAKDGLSDDANE